MKMKVSTAVKTLHFKNAAAIAQVLIKDKLRKRGVKIKQDTRLSNAEIRHLQRFKKNW